MIAEIVNYFTIILSTKLRFNIYLHQENTFVICVLQMYHFGDKQIFFNKHDNNHEMKVKI